jgi:glycosyltransferase involved in cell wall biosynthesis
MARPGRPGPLKILTIGHSYVVALNRRLPRELALAAGDSASVTVAAPTFVKGDLRPIALEPLEGEPYDLAPLPMRLTDVPHLAHYAPGPLRALMRRERWDVIHAWQEPYVLVGGQIAAQAPRDAALIYSTFQNIPKRHPPPFAQIERYCLRRASAWTAFGVTIAEAQRDRPGYADRPMRTIPLGVDTSTFRPDPDAGRRVRASLGWTDDGPPVVGYLGRFVPEKGLPLLTRALDALSPGSWRALVVGSGPMEAELRAWAAGHPDHARVLTGVAHGGVPPHLNAMDLLAAPSQTRPSWREQLGRMLLEAMASGVAVLASDSGEIPHVVDRAGRIVPEADGPAWVAALAELTTDSGLRRDLADRGLARARSVYDWPIVARQFLDVFREVRERPRAQVIP